jgi:hypothetical protein
VGRQNLSPVIPTDLVAVIGLRVVAGRDDDAGSGMEVADGKAQLRCGAKLGEQVGNEAVSCQYRGGHPGELIGAKA